MVELKSELKNLKGEYVFAQKSNFLNLKFENKEYYFKLFLVNSSSNYSYILKRGKIQLYI